MVQFAFLLELTKFGILEFACRPRCVLFRLFARWLLHIKSVRAKKSASVSIELRTEGLVFPQFSRKMSSRWDKKEQTDMGSPCSVSSEHFMIRLWEITGNHCKCSETKFYCPSSLLNHFANARLHAQKYRSIDFCNVYTYIYTYIEQSLLEVCMFFSWISNCKTVPFLKPQNHMTRIFAGTKKSRGQFFGLSFSLFLAADVSIRGIPERGVT